MIDLEERYSRVERKKAKQADRMLTILIMAVVVALIGTATFIFKGGTGEAERADKLDKADKGSLSDTKKTAGEQDTADSEQGITVDQQEKSGIVTYIYENDEIVEKSIVDPSWKPIGTTQTGQHVSSYDGKSVDWQEKKDAIVKSTGLAPDNMITWIIKNGGTVQKSIGIVSSKDETEKYRVYLEWVEHEGWKTVKLDVLKTLNFNY